MKLMPSSSARFITLNDVFSSLPTLCMKDLSSASPNVMAPKQSSETLTPAAPSFLYFMFLLWPSPIARAIGGGAYTPCHDRALPQNSPPGLGGSRALADVCAPKAFFFAAIGVRQRGK